MAPSGLTRASSDVCGKLDNADQEPWKLPLPAFIESIYRKRFGKDLPDVVHSVEERARHLELMLVWDPMVSVVRRQASTKLLVWLLLVLLQIASLQRSWPCRPSADL